MTTALVVASGFAFSAAQPFKRQAVATKIVPKSFMARVKTSNDKRTRCANGNYRRAQHRRDLRNLRGGNCNLAGKAESRSLKLTKGRGRAVRSLRARAAPAAKRGKLPARGTHFVKWKGVKRA